LMFTRRESNQRRRRTFWGAIGEAGVVRWQVRRNSSYWSSLLRARRERCFSAVAEPVTTVTVYFIDACVLCNANCVGARKVNTVLPLLAQNCGVSTANLGCSRNVRLCTASGETQYIEIVALVRKSCSCLHRAQGRLGAGNRRKQCAESCHRIDRIEAQPCRASPELARSGPTGERALTKT
jgi:hypothetical protein